MSLLFSPGIFANEIFSPLPAPITRLQIQDHWDFDRYQVLFTDGDHTRGISRAGVDLTITGSVASVGGVSLLNEEAMFNAIENLRDSLKQQADELFTFYLFRQQTNQTCRYFRECSVTRFQYDLSQPELYSYALTLHADDPVIYQEWFEAA